MKRSLSFVAVLAIALAGCTPVDDAVPTPVPTAESTTPTPILETPTPTPTPTPTAVAETGDTPPAQVLGGDCAAVISASEIEDVWGASLKSHKWELTGYATDFAIRQAGGLRCSWWGGKYARGLIVDAVPIDAVPASTPRGCGSLLADMGGDVHCEFAVTANGTLFSGVASFSNISKAEAKKAVAKLSGHLTANAEAATAVPRPIPAAASWENPRSCDFLRALADDGALLGGAPSIAFGGAGGTDGYRSPVDVYLLGSWDEPYRVVCQFYSTKDLTKKQRAAGMQQYAYLEIVGGAAWAEDAVAALDSAQSIDIPGIDSAYVINADYDVTWFAIFDGPNYAAFHPEKKTGVAQSITAIIDALNAG